jgi:hypothetical protein
MVDPVNSKYIEKVETIVRNAMSKPAVKELTRLIEDNSCGTWVSGKNFGKLRENLSRRLGVNRNRIPQVIRNAGAVEVYDEHSNTSRVILAT